MVEETVANITVKPDEDFAKALNDIKEAAEKIKENIGMTECDMKLTKGQTLDLINCYIFECSECGNRAIVRVGPGEKPKKPRYCPNCGRQVRGR